LVADAQGGVLFARGKRLDRTRFKEMIMVKLATCKAVSSVSEVKTLAPISLVEVVRFNWYSSLKSITNSRLLYDSYRAMSTEQSLRNTLQLIPLLQDEMTGKDCSTK
jgi:hypothetical protein